MHLDRYSYNSSTNKANLDYEFESIGPKGTIMKVVRFLEISEGIYNLGFGDLDISTRKIKDDVITNNGDTEKVLSTVALIARDFILKHPGIILFIEGTSKAKTRLYQINISKYLEEIKQDLEIQGSRNDEWELFRKDTNYDAFIAMPRKSGF